MMLGSVIAFSILVSGISCQSSYVINGDNVQYVGKWPSMCSIMLDFGDFAGDHWCGCSIIDEKWVITAAHCVVTAPAKHWSVKAGFINKHVDTEYTQIKKVEEIHYHEGYAGAQPGHLNDVAVLKLAEPFVFTPGRIEAANLPADDGYDWSFHECAVVGWGRMGRCVDNFFGCYIWKDDCESNKNYMHSNCRKTCGLCDASKSYYPDDLQEASTHALNRQSCQKKWGLDNIFKSHICAFDTELGKRGSCNGDSGGPLFCQRENKWYQVGVFSWMHVYCDTIAHPSVYSRVTSFKDWVNEKTGLNLM